jgi:hypothetical protein
MQQQHKAGSRKGQVHDVFNQKGSDEAVTVGVKLGLKEGTVRSWVKEWSRGTPVTVKRAAEGPPFNMAAWRHKCLTTAKYFTVIPGKGKTGLRHATLAEAIKTARKYKVKTIWVVGANDKFAPINEPEWSKAA